MLEGLVAQQPGCVVFAVDDLVGASPELLLRKCGDHFQSAPIAGTAAPEEMAAVVGSEKDLHEHEFVIAAMREALSRVGADVDEIGAPEVEVLADVAHLITHISGRSPASSLELAQALHPTPAVAGTPTAQAVAVQRDLEGFDRGMYVGPVGWVGTCVVMGNGCWPCDRRNSMGLQRPCSPGRALSWEVTRTRSGPRPNRNWHRCAEPWRLVLRQAPFVEAYGAGFALLFSQRELVI